jgi:hypothetical protein
VGVFVLLLLFGGGAAAVLWRRPDVTDQVREVLARFYPAQPLSRKALPKRLLRAAANTVTVGVTGTVLLPTRIVISVHPDDLEPFADAVDWLGRDIAEVLRTRAAANGWIVPDGPEVSIVADPERPLRVPRAVGHFGALSAEAVATLYRPGPPPAVDVPPTAPAPPTAAAATPTPQPGTAYTQMVDAGVHLRLVATTTNTGDADLSAVVLAGQQPVVLGRSHEAHLRVRDRKVSGRHCAFTVDTQGDLHVEDLQSTNGTAVDEQPVTRTQLRGGETLRAGASAWWVDITPL